MVVVTLSLLALFFIVVLFVERAAGHGSEGRQQQQRGYAMVLCLWLVCHAKKNADLERCNR